MTDIEPRPESAVVEFAHELDSQIRQLAQHAHVVLEALYALVNEAQATNIHVALGFPSGLRIWPMRLTDNGTRCWTATNGPKRSNTLLHRACHSGPSPASTGARKGAIHRET